MFKASSKILSVYISINDCDKTCINEKAESNQIDEKYHNTKL